MNESTIIDLVTQTQTNSTDQTDRDATLAKFEIAILSLIFILIVLGNGSVIIALVGARIKIQRMYYFLLHLSIADLLTAFFNVLPQLCWEITVQFYGNNSLCKFVKYIQLLGPYLSSYVLVVTAIDRYQAICFPLANCTWTERRAKIMIGIAWIISIICCLPQIFIFSYVQIAMTTYPNKTSSFQVYPIDESIAEAELYTKFIYQCWGSFIQPYGEKIYVLWYAVSVFFIPLVVLVFTYFNICKVIWINARDRTNLKASKMAAGKHATTSSTSVITDKNNKKRALIFHSKLAASLSRAARNGKQENETAAAAVAAINDGQLSSVESDDQLLKNATTATNNNLRKRNSLAVVNCPPKSNNLTDHHQLESSAAANQQLLTSNEQQQITISPINSKSSSAHQLESGTQAPSRLNGGEQTLNSGSSRKESMQPMNRTSMQFTKDCCRAQNGQSDLQTFTLSNAGTTNNSKFASNQMKSASSIFASRTAAHTNKLSKAKIKTIQITLVVIICYIACSLPFCAVQLWAHFYPNAQSSSLWTGPLITITMLLPSLNSCVNPWIYLLLNRNLLYTLLKLLCGTKCIDSTTASATEYRNETTNQRLSINMHKNTTAGLASDQQIGPNQNGPNATNSPTNNSQTQSPATTTNIESILRKNRLTRISNSQLVKSDSRIADKLNNKRSATDQLSDKFVDRLGKMVVLNEKSGEKLGDVLSDKVVDDNGNSNAKISINLNANKSNQNENLNQTYSEIGKMDKIRSEQTTTAKLNKLINHSKDKVDKIDTVANLSLMNKINVQLINEKCSTAGMQIANFNLPRVPSETNSLTLTANDQQQIVIYQNSSSAPDLKMTE